AARRSPLRPVALDQAARDQRPAVDQHEEDADLVVHERLDVDVIGVLQCRPHHEGGQEQRDRDDHSVRRRGRRAERGAQQRQHHHDAREEVIITRIDGASDSTVMKAMSWMTRSVSPPPWPRLMLMSCAAAGSAAAPKIVATPAATIARRTRPPIADGFKLCCSDGPTNSPSPVRGCRRAIVPVRPLWPHAQAWFRLAAALLRALPVLRARTRRPSPVAGRAAVPAAPPPAPEGALSAVGPAAAPV